jgi:pimeloyl-ACP methyl ester carboxylesterase
VQCPVLVLTGDQPDTWTEVKDDELAKRVANMPNARHVLVPGTGHYVHIEDPDATMRAIETFLGDVGP